MAFLPKPGEKKDNYTFELSGDEDTRLRKGYIDRETFSRFFCTLTWTDLIIAVDAIFNS